MKPGKNAGPILGSLIGAAVGAIGEISRVAIAKALRDTADKVERGDLVSDDEIDSLDESFDPIREGLRRRGG